jgi:WD40 repeat protein
VYETQKGEPLRRVIAAFRPSGDLRTVWLSDAIVDYVAGTVRRMPDLGYPVLAAYPSPDGKRVFINTGPTGVGFLDPATMEWVSRPSAAEAGLAGDSTVWSDDGSLVASVSEGHLSYWDGRRGDRLGTATVDEADGGPAFSKDNKRLLFAGFHGSVRTWDLDPTSWTKAACRLAGRAMTGQEWHNYLPDRPFQRVCAS